MRRAVSRNGSQLCFWMLSVTGLWRKVKLDVSFPCFSFLQKYENCDQKNVGSTVTNDPPDPPSPLPNLVSGREDRNINSLPIVLWFLRKISEARDDSLMQTFPMASAIHCPADQGQ